MTKIEFSNITRSDSIRLDTLCIITDQDSQTIQYPLWFESNQPLTWDNDSIALSLSTLCGRTYEEIYIDLAVSEEVVERIRQFTLATVKTRGNTKSIWPLHRGGCTLNFSGGFDSLSALSLMPKDTKLVSLDFGGSFTREKIFFKQFDPIIITTNLTNTPLRANSWSFMGIGTLLTTGITGSEYISFGGILENTSDGIRKQPEASKAGTFIPYAAAGYTNAGFVAGITEVGTTKILLKDRPDLILESLQSLAGPGSEKYYRKTMLVKILSERLGISIDVQDPVVPNSPKPFGHSFTADFIALYIGRFAGRAAREAVISDVPEEVDAAVAKLDLNFVERTNPTLYERFPSKLFPDLAQRLYQLGLKFYGETDWAEFATLRQAFSNHYPEVMR